MFNDPIMTVINKNLSYKDRREVLNIMTESSAMKDSVYANIGKYFMKGIQGVNPINSLRKYLACNGDITKIKDFNQCEESLSVLSRSTQPGVVQNATVINEAINNLKSRERNFKLGIKNKDSATCKLIFGCVAKLIVGSVSLLIIDTGLPYGDTNPKIGASRLPISGLGVFNTYCKNGVIDKVLRMDINLGGRAIVHEDFENEPSFFTVLATMGSAFITAIRSAVYWVYYTRMDMAEYLEQQAAYLELNKLQLKNRTDLTPEEKKEIIKKQTEWQKTLLDLSDKIQIDDIKAVKKAQDKAKKEEKDMTANDAKNGGDSQDSSGDPDFF